MHPTAVVEEGAELAAGVEVGPYAVIGPRVRLAEGCEIMAHAFVDGRTEIGRGTLVFPYAAVGGRPQDMKYAGEDSRLVVGERNMIREGVTINIGTKLGGGVTRVGDDNVLMANAHVAHDCFLGSRIILANNVMLAGHVCVQDGAIVNGGVGVHHFTTIGSYAYVGGLSRITRDVPPFIIVEGHPSRVRGLNVIGLKRARFPDATIRALKEAYKLVYRSDKPMKDALAALRVDFPDVPQVQELVRFLEASEGGRQGRQGEEPERRLAP
ncbi:MAG: acyl-ACP--UDP-N-acetylglucosamine O-acyltransferase [Planctomycetota bacterium]